jgi:hypothetical protein
MMQDTTPEMRQKQLDIIFSKTEGQRLLMGLEMMEDVRKIVMRSIKLGNPGFSEADCKIEFVRRYYKADFRTAQLDEIAEWFRNNR